LEYRLSPEHPFPAPVDDTVAIYRALLRENISPSQLMIMGDSAGGGLSLLTIQALLVNQLPIPRGVIVLSPWTDLSSSGESYKRNRQADVMFRNMKEDDGMIKLILGPDHSKLSADNPVFSPLFGSFEGFPPMYINVGTAEVLEDDSRRVAKKAQEANVNVTFEEGLHLMHVYPVFFPYYPEARNSLDNINKWMQTMFDQKQT
jgi:monoterpene epsilon-lactone hydrolase